CRNSTAGPTTQYGPISTSSATCAPSATLAVGSIRATLDLDNHGADLGLRPHLAPHLGLTAIPPHVAAIVDLGHVKLDDITGHDRPPEFRFVDRQEIDEA